MANGEWKAGRQEGEEGEIAGLMILWKEEIEFSGRRLVSALQFSGRAMKIGCRLNAMRNGGQCPPYRVAGRS